MATLTLKLSPPLYPKQHAALFDPARYVWIEASTKSGKTLGALQWILMQAQSMPERGNAWWIAPIYPQAKIAYSRLKGGLAGCPDISTNESELTVTLPGQRRIWFKSAERPDGLFGEDCYAAVADEASRCKEEAWHALRSTLTKTRGPVRFIGNVKGRRNWFYRGARLAESGHPDHAFYRLTAYDAIQAGVLASAEIEDAKRTLPEHVFRELYLAEPSDDEGNPFGIRAIEACIIPALADGPAVAWGCDLAKSVDWTVLIGLDAAGKMCRYERWQTDWGQTLNRISTALQREAAAVLVDSTGVGDAIVEDLQRRCGWVEGYHFTSQSKQVLMEMLASEIHQGNVGFPEGVLAQELRDFEYEFTKTGVRYTAPEGLHDDCVCALALAVRALRMGGGGLRPEALQLPDRDERRDSGRDADRLFV